ncbi:MAG: EAL domain-containing protein [Hyphomicrobiales bacterium]|nr:EAL domain-containing protein [Hyphomicrobiales bacterium]
MNISALHQSQPSVLIVDDDLGNCLFLQTALEQSGFSTALAHDGYAALKQFKNQPPDLVLLDIQMPNMNGFETCEEILKLEVARSTAIIMMTALDDDDSINRAFEAGSTSFITKPINPQLLVHRLRYFLRAMQNEMKLRHSQEQLAHAHSLARLGHFEYDLGSSTLSLSESFKAIFELPTDIETITFDQFISMIEPDQRNLVQSSLTNRHSDEYLKLVEYNIVLDDNRKKTIFQENNISSSTKENISKYFVIVQDITERREAENQIRYLSFIDKTTGLPNRNYFEKKLDSKISQSDAEKQKFALLSVDVDNFRRVNDSLGPHISDNILKEIGERLCACLRLNSSINFQQQNDLNFSTFDREKDCIAHLDGDRYIILLAAIRSPQDAAKAAERFTQALLKPFIANGQEILLTLSIGISIFPQDGQNGETLLRSANSALHHAQHDDHSAFSFYTTSLNEDASRRLSIETKLRKAVENEEFVVFYQPRIDILTGAVISAEALVRWYDPDEGLIPPNAFIPIAEETGLIVPLGEWVLRTTCAHMARWRSDGLQLASTSVNLSAVQFKQKNLFETIQDAMKQNDIPPGDLELEITESTIVANIQNSIDILQHLKSIGVKLSIDDFGTGYSSLSYLKRFPLTSLKIDRSFVKDIEVCADDTAIVTAIIGLAKSLRLRVVAEGIETQAQLAFLRASGCDEGQGFLFSPPLPAHEFVNWLKIKAA